MRITQSGVDCHCNLFFLLFFSPISQLVAFRLDCSAGCLLFSNQLIHSFGMCVSIYQALQEKGFHRKCIGVKMPHREWLKMWVFHFKGLSVRRSLSFSMARNMASLSFSLFLSEILIVIASHIQRLDRMIPFWCQSKILTLQIFFRLICGIFKHLLKVKPFYRFWYEGESQT